MKHKQIKNIEVIYEDEDVLAVNKPAGLVVHPDGKTDEYTLTDWILENYPDIKDVGEPTEYNGKIIPRPGIVHRIDRDTSGILIIAKTQKSYEFLKGQFKDRNIKKTYRAFVYGNIKEDSGVIDKPIGRSGKDFRMKSAQRGARGELRDAVTLYKVLDRNKDVAYLELYPKTGRTHQLRVHLKAISHPIVCDSLYAPKRDCMLGFDRLALHAYSLELALPGGVRIKLDAPLPEDFESAVANLKDL